MTETMNFSMQRFLKQMAWLAGMILVCQSAFGFALIGPIPPATSPDDWQIPGIGYGFTALILNLTTTVNGATFTYNQTASPSPLGDIGTPKNINEGYRRNTPVLYYAFDASFMKFFGPEGAAEVDKAMAVYNNLAPVSEYSADLSEFPTETRRQNFRAGADSLLDLKSQTMGMLTEQLGFFQPVRWVWCLHGRVVLPGGCPGDVEYSVIKRNFNITSTGPDAYASSSYVNNVLYTYFIFEGCTTLPLADAIEVPVDPLSNPGPYSAVADYDSFWYRGLTLGTFYTGLTQDDMGGLRYLINSNNVANEASGVWTEEFETNAEPAILTNQDLNLFAALAATNPPAALLGLYPGLIINTVSNSFDRARTTNITVILINSPLDPAGTPPSHPLFTTNYTTNVVQFFHYTFANVITNSFSTRGLVGTVSLGLTNSPYSPAGTPPTVVTNSKMTFVNGSFGGFFLLPTNLCAVQILSNILTQVIATTNLPAAIITTTNAAGGAANPALVFTPGNITFFTNDTLIYLPVTCPPDTVANFQGVEKISFIRRDYDSLLNQFWAPVTNDYTLVELTNSTLIPRHMRRAIPKPDIVFSAADLVAGTSFTYSNSIVTTNFSGTTALNETVTYTEGAGVATSDAFRWTTYDQAHRPGNESGPGTIVSLPVLPNYFIFNEIGPLYLNGTALLLLSNVFTVGEADQIPFFDISWGSFDGTTNPPTVYPNGSSITNLESLLTGPFITTATLPNANVGVSYSAQLSATGGQPPYTWSLSPGSAGLPSGLNLTSDGQITGTPVGPGGGAIYDFSIRLTDSAGAFKDEAYVITVF